MIASPDLITNGGGSCHEPAEVFAYLKIIFNEAIFAYRWHDTLSADLAQNTIKVHFARFFGNHILL
jgi:hypothetical protein